MYAIVETGGKQYRVEEGTILRAEKIEGQKGDKIAIDKVLMVGGAKGLKTGLPYVSGANIEVEIVEQDRNEKVLWFKKRRRKNSRRKGGHRQDVTVLRVTGINA